MNTSETIEGLARGDIKLAQPVTVTSYNGLVPAWDFVIVKLDSQSDKTAGGILYVPETAKDAPSSGTIVAVGPGKKDDDCPMFAQVGDRIFFGRYAGNEKEWRGENLLFLREVDIIAFIKEGV